MFLTPRTASIAGFFSLIPIVIHTLPALGQGARSGHQSESFQESGVAQEAEGGIRANGLDFGLLGNNEPAIAVNPLNSLNIAYGSLFRSRVSTDGGVNWSLNLLATVPAGYSLDGDSTLAFDSQGRLFWEYLGFFNATSRGEVIICQLNPTTGAVIAGPFRITTTASTSTGDNDKGWLAADRFVGSPFRDRLYVAWTDFNTSPSRVLFSFSSNQGATWSAAIQLSVASEGFPWPTHVAVAPNGDVYVSYHSQTGFNGIGELGGNPDGVSGKVYVLRSTNGGVSFPQKTLAYTAGQADMTYNVQTSPGTLPSSQFWTQGAGQAWVVPDVKVPGNVYVVSNDDPDNAHGSGDDSNVYVARSTDNGLTWAAPIRVDHGPGTSYAIMPTAAMDDLTGCMVVMWYDNRLGNFNGGGHYLLDVYYSVSDDHGLTWGPDTQINDAHFNPDLGAPQRLAGPPATLRIGEYIAVTMGGGSVYGVWCGNTGAGQQSIFDSAVGACRDCNHNGAPDSFDIRSGASQDCNSNAQPDECELPPCAGFLLADLNCDTKRDGKDIQQFVRLLTTGGYLCSGDMNQDGLLSPLDLTPFVNAVLTGP